MDGLLDQTADMTVRDDLAFLKGMRPMEPRGFGRGAVWHLVKKEAGTRRKEAGRPEGQGRCG